MRFMNSGANFRLAAPGGRFLDLFVQSRARIRRNRGRKSHAARHQLRDLAAAQVRRHEDHRLRQIHAPVVPERERRLVQNPQQQLPQRIGRLFDFVKQQEADLQLLGVILRERLLRDQRMRLAVPEISRRRADQLGNLVRVLELGAINLEHRARIAEQHFRRGFDDARLPRPGGSEEQQVAHGTSRRVQPGAKHLVQIHHRLHRFVLPYDLAAHASIEILGLETSARRVQLSSSPSHHVIPPVGPIGRSQSPFDVRLLHGLRQKSGHKLCRPSHQSNRAFSGC
jgi:hypothetical protein